MADELAFPLLLRGLSPAWAWTDLVRAEIPKEREKEVIDSPQDLLHFDFDEVGDTLITAKKIIKGCKNTIFLYCAKSDKITSRAVVVQLMSACVSL